MDIVERLRYAATSRPGGICEEAANEIERLTAERDRAREYHAAELADVVAEAAQLREYLDTAQRRASALGAEVAGLREDAERYRWLRDKARSVDWTESINGWSWTQHCRIGARGMDAAIDAARKGSHADQA